MENYRKFLRLSRKFRKERILKPGKDRSGYLYIILRKDKKSYTKKISILVYETFYNDKLKSNECIHHIDGSRDDNYNKNLEKMTKFDHNSFHKKNKIITEDHKYKISKNHSDIHGEKHPRHKLTEEQVIQIKLLLKEGILTQREIAKMFNVSFQLISLIKSGKIWLMNGEKE